MSLLIHYIECLYMGFSHKKNSLTFIYVENTIKKNPEHYCKLLFQFCLVWGKICN